MQVIVIGGGAAGFFAALHIKEHRPDIAVTILEKSANVLAKVEISGGGRCNVTHACFDPKRLVQFYPRGGRELLGAFFRWNPQHTVDWFSNHGVELKTEDDGRMFPVTDSSSTIIECLTGVASRYGVEVRTNSGVVGLETAGEGFIVKTSRQELRANAVVVATGGNRAAGGWKIAAGVGHTIVDPVPSLFTFHIRHPLLTDLAGLSVDPAVVRVSELGEEQAGPVLITHKGLSGPGILKLSAWNAVALAERNYRFDLFVDWTGGLGRGQMEQRLAGMRSSNGAKRVANASPIPLPKRLWHRMLDLAGCSESVTWSTLPAEHRESLLEQLVATRLPVAGKTLNKDEFVTCGGVDLKEVDMKTFQSKVCPGLFFAGEVLNIDGVTGGFNFQAAWTGGALAGQTIGDELV